MRVRVEPPRRVYRLINHGPTTLISSAASGRRNVMSAAWVVPLDFEPPLLGVVLASDTLTCELVRASREMVVSLPTREMVDLAYAVGTVSGREVDKFSAYGIRTSPASLVSPPLIEGCAAWLECKVRTEPALEEQYGLFVGEVVAAWADDRVFADGLWAFSDARLRTIHHLTKGIFLVTGERVDAREPAAS